MLNCLFRLSYNAHIERQRENYTFKTWIVSIKVRKLLLINEQRDVNYCAHTHKVQNFTAFAGRKSCQNRGL